MLVAVCVCSFFFVKQKTAYEVRISDWSSDVCSSDLGNVGAAPGVGRGRQVVGVGFAAYLENRQGQAFGYFGTAGEPFGIGPALQNGARIGVALVGFVFDVVEGVEHQQRLLERFGGDSAQLCVIEQFDTRSEEHTSELQSL